jgi:GNAT superfamily N-acetyltransferase
VTKIIEAQAADLDPLAAVIAEAFCDLPPSRWLISDQASRRKIFPAYFRILVQHALAHGVVHTTRQRTAAALWLPVPGEPAPQPPGYVPRLTSVTWPWTDRFLSFDHTLDTHHPAGTAHHHLAILAVHPSHQHRGTGTALLNTYHHELDQAHQAAYLEAPSERNRDLYLRHGYVLRPDAPFFLPDCGPPFWPMWRQPRR